ncbi:MAG: hypothetical protein K2M75_00345, partial [Clostridia bacterium]|nr:hypothetical protein [Clostridia bacterium]
YYIRGQYSTASFAYNQLRNLKWITDIDRYFYYVNYLVCLKYTDKEELNNQLVKWKTSTDAPIFKIAKQLIKNDYANINNMIKNIFISNEEYYNLSDEECSFYLIKGFIKEWPLFKDYRETEYYKSLCEELHL